MESLFIGELFKDEYNHSGEKIYIENLKFRVPFQKRKVDLSIFTFDALTTDQSFENKIQKSFTDQCFENLFEDELMYLDD